MENRTLCPDCKAEVPDFDGTTHPYLGASPGCWKLYGDVLAKEYSDPIFMQVHRLTVDAYAAQHPGKHEPRAAQSVNIHLFSLCLIFERQMPFDLATRSLSKLIEKRKGGFKWLPPPATLGRLTIVDVVTAKSPEEHAQKVREWAECVWHAWQPHRDEIEELVREIL